MKELTQRREGEAGLRCLHSLGNRKSLLDYDAANSLIANIIIISNKRKEYVLLFEWLIPNPRVERTAEQVIGQQRISPNSEIFSLHSQMSAFTLLLHF